MIIFAMSIGLRCQEAGLAAHLAGGQQASDGNNHVGILRMTIELPTDHTLRDLDTKRRKDF
jgi:hypothetical protein